MYLKMKKGKVNEKKELDELPGFGKLLNEKLKTEFIKTIKKNKAGKIK